MAALGYHPPIITNACPPKRSREIIASNLTYTHSPCSLWRGKLISDVQLQARTSLKLK